MSGYDSFYKRFLTFFGFIACLLLPACSVEANSLKMQILNAVPKNSGEVIPFDMQKLNKRKILRMCVQNNPYLTKEALEKILSIEINNFSEIDDLHFVLWLVHDEGQPTKIEFKKAREISYSSGAPEISVCTSSANIWLSNSELRLNKFN